tara:strand:- start:1755 stop:2396 length:642 start_codon:yes stop_codon:yes gene_type:complete
MKLKITRERFNQIVQEEHQRIQEEKEEAEVQYHKGFRLKPGETPEDFEAEVERERERKAALSQSQMKQFVRMNPGLKEEEHAEPVGAGIEDISADDVLGNQPGLGFDLGSQEAFRLLYTQYDGGRNKAQIGKDFEKIAQIDPKLSDVFKALILSNPILFPNETPGSIDLLRNDPEAVDAALAAIPDEPEELEEDISDSLVKEIQNLLKQQGNL